MSRIEHGENDQDSNTEQRRNQALALHKAGNLSAAESQYRSIIKATNDGMTWHYLAVLLGQRGLHAEVVTSCEQAISSGFVSASVYGNLGLALAELGRPRAAAEAFSESLRLDPDNAELTLEWIRLTLSLGEETSALQSLQAARNRFPHISEFATELALLAAQLNRGELAQTEFEQALALQPQAIESWVNLGNILQMRGKPDAAVAAYERALAIDPAFADIYWYLAQNLDPDSDTHWKDTILAMAASPQYLGSAPIQFAAGKIHHDAGQIDRAFGCFQTGNRIVRSSYSYSVEADLVAIKELLVESARVAGNAFEDAAPTPVFIVGMPRSGSTLLEQLLAQHPQIAAGGEVVWLQRLIRDTLKSAGLGYPVDQSRLNSQQLESIRRRYLMALTARSKGSPFVTDKLPANFLCVPTITKLFPNALIIHAKRDLMDTCWSCYRHYFSGPQQFAYEQSELGRYGSAVHEFMQAMEQRVPERIVTINHETLVENAESELRGLLTRLGLPWDENCLLPERSGDTVMTASALQVRKGISKKTAGASQPYESHLQELRESLRPAGAGRIDKGRD